MKTNERAEAARLRREEGRSVKEIAALLGVSRSSVSLWVRGIELTTKQQEALRDRNPVYNRQRSGWRANAALSRARRLASQEEGRRLAQSGGSRFASGCMLYWAEGAKARNAVRFTNSDPEMSRIFLAFLREYFDVSDDKVRISCNLFVDHEERQREIERFWLDTLDLPATSLCKTTVNRYSRWSAKKRTNKLPYGTCRIAVHDTRIVQAIYGGIQELGGFDRPEWLDL
jgi:transposase-like protein